MGSRGVGGVSMLFVGVGLGVGGGEKSGTGGKADLSLKS